MINRIINYGKYYTVPCFQCNNTFKSTNKYLYHVCPTCSYVYHKTNNVIKLTKNCLVICPCCDTKTDAYYNKNGYCKKCHLIFEWKELWPIWYQYEKIT